jgi:hypothetical protein
MTIFYRTRRALAYGASMMVAAFMALTMMSAPSFAPTANAQVDSSEILLLTIQKPGIACKYANKNIHYEYAVTQYARELGGVAGKEIIRGGMALSILAECPWHAHLYAPTVVGEPPYGPWANIPTRTPVQAKLMAYQRGYEACGIASNQGVEAGVRFLSEPHWTIPYPPTWDEARAGMLISAASRCAYMMPAVRVYLGG